MFSNILARTISKGRRRSRRLAVAVPGGCLFNKLPTSGSEGRNGFAARPPLSWGVEPDGPPPSPCETDHEPARRQGLSPLDPRTLRPPGPCARRQAPGG